MKIILDRKLEECTSYKCSRGFSYELSLLNVFNLARAVKPEYFVEPKDTESILNLCESFNQVISFWAYSLNRVKQIKETEYAARIFSNTLTLSSYQVKAFEICRTLDRAFLFMEQGTGKTPVALALIKSRPECSTLIVCPKAVRNEWALMLEQFFPEIKWSIITQNTKFVPEKGHVYITNYDRMRLMDKMQFNQIILDECHRLKNPTGASNKALYEIQKSASYVYGLTGTPYGNRLIDVYGIGKVVDERLFGSTKNAFESKYCNIVKQKTKSGQEFNVVTSYKNLDDFKTRIESISFRVLKKDCLDLIDPVETRLWVDNCKEYKSLKKEYMLELDGYVATVKNVLNLTFKLQQVCSGFIRTEEAWAILNENKLNALSDWLISQDDEEEVNNQVVIYVTYDMSEKMILKKLNLLGKKVGIISGQVSDAEKESVKKRFKDKELDIVLIKYKSGTEGLNFQNCNKMVFYDLTPSFIDYEQARARIHRRGQERECIYVHLITQDSVEEKIYKALQQRKDFSTYLLEGNNI